MNKNKNKNKNKNSFLSYLNTTNLLPPKNKTQNSGPLSSQILSCDHVLPPKTHLLQNLSTSPSFPPWKTKKMNLNHTIIFSTICFAKKKENHYVKLTGTIIYIYIYKFIYISQLLFGIFHNPLCNLFFQKRRRRRRRREESTVLDGVV